MRLILSFFVMIFFVNSAMAQHAELKGDTLYYQGAKYYQGQKLTLAYGSKPSKEFAFIWMGSGFAVGANAPASWSKTDIIVQKFQHGGGKNYIKGKLMNALGNMTIDLEGAIDNKELLSP